MTETINFKTQLDALCRHILQPIVGWSPVVSPETHDHTVFNYSRL